MLLESSYVLFINLLLFIVWNCWLELWWIRNLLFKAKCVFVLNCFLDVDAGSISNLRVLSEICVKSVKINGYLVFMKGNIDEELDNLDSCLNKLGLSIEKIDRFNLPIENSNRSIIMLKKNKKTPDIYPRSVDKIKKLPL